MKKSFLFISCEEAKHICDKSQYGESTSWERTKLKLRLMYCHITKTYAKKNNKLTDAVQKSKLTCLERQEREKLQHRFEEELAKHQ